MKKLAVLFFALTVLPAAAFAQKDLGRTLTRKTAAARAAAAVPGKARTVVSITHYQPETYIKAKHDTTPKQGTLQVQTHCSALLLNAKGTLAIKRDCLNAINNAANHHQIIVFVDLQKLGSYQDWEPNVPAEMVGTPYAYFTENASLRDFLIKEDFILFALPVRSNALKTALAGLFPNGREITAEKAAAALKTMPAAKTVEALHLNTFNN